MKVAISHSVIGEKAKRKIEKLLAYENANQECQRAIAPIHETGNIIDSLKGCHNLRSETQKMQMLAETMAAAFKRGNERCFTYGDKTHLKKKKDCPKKHREKIKTAKKNLQDFALIAIRGYIGPGNVSLNMLLKESLF